MQNDLFEGPVGARIQNLRHQKTFFEKELRRIKAELNDTIREGTSVAINESRTLFLCQLPSGRHYIYQADIQGSKHVNPLFEFLAVDLNQLEEAVRVLKETHYEKPHGAFP